MQTPPFLEKNSSGNILKYILRMLKRITDRWSLLENLYDDDSADGKILLLI